MRDYALLAILISFVLLALYRPWLGVLGLAVLGFMHPQGYGDAFMERFPAYLILFVATTISLVAHHFRDGKSSGITWSVVRNMQIAVLLALFLWFGVTTFFSLVYYDALEKYQEVLKILPPLVLTLILINTREKLFALITVIALSVLLVAAKGGYWALMTGFSDRVYGPPGSAYYGNNEFAVVVSMTIPLLVIWLNQTRDKWLRSVIMAGIALCYGSVISSWSRGAMLALIVVTLLLVWHNKKKLLVLPLLLLLVAVYLVQLPDTWFGRMQTLASIGEDGSAQARLEVWRIGLEFAIHHPITGGGFNAWLLLTPFRDWHSAYFEVLAEHGFVGLTIWLALIFGTMASLTRLGWVAGKMKLDWVANYSNMLRASLMAYAVGSLTLGTTYWEFPYHLVVISAIFIRLGMGNTRMAMTQKD